MKLIKRKLQETVTRQLGKNKVILIKGTRRVGKTVLVDAIRQNFKGNTLMLNAEDFDVQEILRNRSVANFKRIIGNATLLIIDEAQVLPGIGASLKLMIDSFPELTIIVTGSSSFDLVNKTGEPFDRKINAIPSLSFIAG